MPELLGTKLLVCGCVYIIDDEKADKILCTKHAFKELNKLLKHGKCRSK